MRARGSGRGFRDTAEALVPHVERAEAAIEPHVNRAVMTLGLMYPLAMAPQLYNVWALHRTAGLSGVTSGMGLAMALTWTVYGLIHRERAIWVLNAIWVVVHTAMVAGLLQ